MASAFISYRRIPSAMLAQLIRTRLQNYGIDAYVDTSGVDGAGPFPDRLRRAIENRDVFICLLAETTFDSDWVKREIEHAHVLGKPMIPIFQESYNDNPPSIVIEEHVKALLNQDGVHIFDRRNLYVDEAIQTLAGMIEETTHELHTTISQSKPLKFRKQFDVHAGREGGIPTGIRVQPGDVLQISANGSVIFDEQGTEADPDGWFLHHEVKRLVQWPHEMAYETRDNSSYIGSLYGWIAERTKERSFFIGKRYTSTLSDADNGELFLAVNDAKGKYGDNQGFFRASVDVYRDE